MIFIVIKECLDGREAMDEAVSTVELVTSSKIEAEAKARVLAREAKLSWSDDKECYFDSEEGMTLIYIDHYTRRRQIEDRK